MKFSVYLIRNILQLGLVFGLVLLGGCSAVPEKQVGELPAQRSVDDIVSEDVNYVIDVYDPIEGFNRGVYRFNAGFDEYIFLPVVSVYEAVVPDVIEDAVSNFFNNFFEITNLTNSILQLNAKKSFTTTGRFLVNTTVGLAGTIDVASNIGLYEQDEDFGQTLGYYGVGNGPYLVLPIIGPSNLRDTTGMLTDHLILSEIDPLNFDDHSEREVIFQLLRSIDTRKNIDFRYFGTDSPFEYELVRLLYTQKRELDIKR